MKVYVRQAYLDACADSPRTSSYQNPIALALKDIGFKNPSCDRFGYLTFRNGAGNCAYICPELKEWITRWNNYLPVLPFEIELYVELKKVA